MKCAKSFVADRLLANAICRAMEATPVLSAPQAADSI
jgi:hypothetical protein